MKYFFFSLVALVLVVICLISILKRNNPFEKNLFKGYSIQHAYASLLHRPSFSNNYVEIRFNKRKFQNKNSFRDAIFETKYLYPDVETVVLEGTLYEYSGEMAKTAAPFFFKCLDLKNLSVENSGNSFKFNVEQLKIPADIVVLPLIISQIRFPINCSDLEALYIPHKTVIPCYPNDFDNTEFKIIVQSEFQIGVPPELVVAYQNDPRWASIKLFDSDNNPVPLRFVKYYS